MAKSIGLRMRIRTAPPLLRRLARSAPGRVVPVLLSVVAIGACGEAPPFGQPTGELPALAAPAEELTTTTTSIVPMVSHDDLLGTIVVVEGEVDFGAEQTVNDRMLRLGNAAIELSYQPSDGLGGSLVPWVVPTHDGSSVYYTMWEDRKDLDELEPGAIGGIPVIRQVDLSAGTDREWRRGAYAVSASASGRIGFVEDLDGAYRFSVPNPNRVMVAVAGEPDQAWSTETDLTYITMGWAGDTLLAYTQGEGGFMQTFAFDGPGKRRLLSDGGVVGAISPDGTEVLVVEVSENGSRFVVQRVADGTVVASFDPVEKGLAPVFSTNGGDWRDDRIVLPAATEMDGRSEVGMVVLSRSGDSLKLEQFVGLSMQDLTYIPEWLQSVDTGELRLRATISGESSEQYVEIECDLNQETCQTVSPLVDLRASAVVNNLSRGASQ